MVDDRESRDDAALVADTLRGEREAFGVLLLRHYGSVVALCRRLLGETPDAQDVAQEAALQAFLGLARLEDPERFGAWLHAIAANLARMALRRRRALSLEALGESGSITIWADRRPAPEEVHAARELHDEIVAALEKLSAANRAAAIGFYLQGYSYAELAALLGVPLSTVKGRLFKGRRQLRRSLAPLAEDVLRLGTSTEEEGAMETSGLVEVMLEAIRISMLSEHRVVVLREVEGSRSLCIFIGPAEADAIRMALEGLQPQRPMTHDLSLQLLHTLGARVERIVVSRLLESTFYAEVELRRGRQTYRVDARPSDAFALALRAGSPLFVARDVLEAAGTIEQVDDAEVVRQELKHPPALVNLRLMVPADQASAREVEWEGQRLLEIRVPGSQSRLRLLMHPEDWERFVADSREATAGPAARTVPIVDVLLEGEAPLFPPPQREGAP